MLLSFKGLKLIEEERL